MCVCVCVVRFLAERYDTKFNVKLDGFRSQLLASYKETVFPWMTIYTLPNGG